MKRKIPFTKIIVLIYSISFIVWVSWSYILASIGREEIAQDLSSQVVIVGIAAILGYMLKAYSETKQEEKIKLEKEKLGLIDTPEKQLDSEEDEGTYEMEE